MPQRAGVRHLPRRQRPKGRLPPRPDRPRRGAPAVHGDRHRPAAAHFGLVGPRAQDQLLWRLAHEPQLVPLLRRRLARRLLLLHLLRNPAHPPRRARRPHVLAKVRRRLGALQEQGALPFHPGPPLTRRPLVSAPHPRRRAVEFHTRITFDYLPAIPMKERELAGVV
eukprot:scaffold71517_cov55-Phaeocystis_antarctica.AAC.6